jgi:hypothetical protein
MNLKTALLSAALLTAIAATSGAANAGSLENLERERAHLIELMNDPSIAADQRQVRIESAARRLRDLERMVMRDESLVGRNTPVVRTAFENYDLTFLVHSAAEDGTTLTQKWFSEIGLSSASLLSARPGSR